MLRFSQGVRKVSSGLRRCSANVAVHDRRFATTEKPPERREGRSPVAFLCVARQHFVSHSRLVTVGVRTGC